MGDIFISYSSANRPFALQIAERLEQFYDVWIDREGIEGGMQWEVAIEKAITDCTVFIVIVSVDSNHSKWVHRETIRADGLNKQIIPILLNDELPLRLLNLHFVDFQGEFEGGFKDLLEALQLHLEPKDKKADSVKIMLGEAVQAQLSGDYTTARNLIGQALTIQPELAGSVNQFWEKLAQQPQTNYALAVEQQFGHQRFIREKVETIPKQDGGQQMYQWQLYLHLPDDVLDEIDYVHYQLHPTFKNPDVLIRDRKSDFRLRIVGWGIFEIPIQIHFKDGSTFGTEHELTFPV